MSRHSGSHMQGLPRQQNNASNQHRHRKSYGVSGETVVSERNGSMIGSGPSFEMARSPPNAPNKNTKHVPCKFFRQGTCQAGNACPFSHSLDPIAQQAPCKYFMKGNCKFGAKCALAHYLPNGHRVSKADLDPALAMSSRTYGVNGRTDAPSFHASESPLTEQYMQSQHYPDYFQGQEQFPLLEDEADAYNDRYNQYRHMANPESGLNSPPTSQFGSPPNENPFPKSPVENLRSALNAPLPASFDANSLPHIAKFGPYGQSVPDKFGMRSPPSSSLSQKLGSPPTRDSIFRGPSINSNLKTSSPLGASPQNVEGSIGQRIMHSQRASRPRMISASVPTHDWENELGTETDLLPSGLHDEVLTPQERMRRLSRPDQELSSSAKERSEGLSIPRRSSSIVGSPPTSGSPSRFRAFFEEQQREKNNLTGPIVPSTNNNSGFGHVGSPLRETWMPNEPSDPRRGVQISGISQAMARMELNRTESTESNGSRIVSGGLGARGMPSTLQQRFDRTISSPGLPSRKIDEEGEFFPMDDENSKRNWFDAQQVRSGVEMPRNDRGLAIENGVRPMFGFRP